MDSKSQSDLHAPKPELRPITCSSEEMIARSGGDDSWMDARLYLQSARVRSGAFFRSHSPAACRYRLDAHCAVR